MKIRNLFLLLILLCNKGIAQNHQLQAIDSLLNVIKNQKKDTLLVENLNLISKNYLYQDSEKGIEFAKKGLALSKELNWDNGIGLSHLNIAIHEVSLGKYLESKKNFDIAKKIFIKNKDNFFIASVYIEMGILKANQSNYPESLDCFFKALKLYESIKDKDVQKSIGSCYENIGTIYNLTNNYDAAIENYTKAIEILRKTKNREIQIALNEANIGIIYQKKEDFKKAIENYKLAEQNLLNSKDYFALATVNSWMGSAYLKQKNFDLSIQNSRKALEYLKNIKDKELVSSTTQNLGYAEFEKRSITGNKQLVNEGYQKIMQSLKLYSELNNHEGLMKAHLYLSEYYTYTKSFENALSNYKLYATYNDSIYNFKNKQSLQNLQDQRTIDLKNKEIQLNKITLENKEKQKYFFIAGLVLLGIIGGLLYYQSRNRKKTNEKLQLLNSELDQANEAKTRFFSILNHDLRAPVANLVNFLQLQSENSDLIDEETAKQMQNKTIVGAENLLNSMEDILQWSKSQMKNFKPQPKQIFISRVFDDIKTHFSSFEKIELLFENQDNIVLVTDENYLKTIIRNLTANAIKATENIENPKIVLKAWQENNQSFISITDNGKGADLEQFKALYDETEVTGIKSGLGLHLIRDMAKAISCSVSLDKKIQNGTSLVLIFTK